MYTPDQVANSLTTSAFAESNSAKLIVEFVLAGLQSFGNGDFGE